MPKSKYILQLRQTFGLQVISTLDFSTPIFNPRLPNPLWLKSLGMKNLGSKSQVLRLGLKSWVLKCFSTCQTCHKFPFHRFQCRENSMEYICKCHKHFVTYIQICIQPEERLNFELKFKTLAFFRVGGVTNRTNLPTGGSKKLLTGGR